MTDRERLLHDVGKYVARTAANLPEGADVPEPLIPLLLRDVYGRGDEPRASETFDRLVGASAADPALADCRALLEAMDALEAPARDHDPSALRELAAHARELASRLRAWAR